MPPLLSFLIFLSLGIFLCTSAQTCEDSTTFIFAAWGGKKRTCTWLGDGTNAMVLRKQEVICPLRKKYALVKDECPKACDNCPQGPSISPSPSKLPSVSYPPLSSPSISNNPTLSSCIEDETFTKSGKTCSQIRNNESNRDFFCQKTDVREKCPVACGLCCADSPTYTFGRNDKTCAWIALQSSRKSKLCVQSVFRKSKRVVYMCSKTCNTCEDEIIVE